MASDIQFSNNLVLRSVRDQVEKAGIHELPLPEPQPMNDDQEQVLDEIAGFIRDIGDTLDREPKFNDMVDGFARVVDIQSFKSLTEKVFHNSITWGKIVSFICVVGKSIAKIVADYVPGVVLWTLNFFKDKLQNWICIMGGWINSISSLACFSFELNDGSSSSLILPSSGLLFIIGVLMGGFIVWSLNRRT